MIFFKLPSVKLRGFPGWHKIGVLIFCLGWLSPLVSASPIPQLNLVSSCTSLIPQDAAIQNTFAYVVDKNNFVVLDISTPALPVEKARLDISKATINDKYSNEPVRLTLMGHYAYLATCNGLIIFDISQPGAPTIVSVLSLPYSYSEYPTQIVAAGDYVYLASLTHLYSINVKDPSKPALSVQASDSYYSGNDVFVLGTMICTVGQNGLGIWDITNPETIREIATLSLAGTPVRVAVSGSFAYVGLAEQGLRIINIADPLAPVQSAYLSGVESDSAVQISGTQALVSGRAYLNYAYHQKLNVVNIADPSAPSKTSSADMPLVFSHCFFSGSLLIATHSNLETDLYDISDPLVVKNLGGFKTKAGEGKLAFYNSLVYMAAEADGVRIFDLADKNNPKELSGINWTSFSANQVCLSGGNIIVGGDAGIRILDLSVPMKPIEVGNGFLKQISNIQGMIITGSILYLFNNWTFYAIDISTPAIPTILGTLQLGTNIRNVVISDSVAYLVADQLGICVIDLSSPRQLHMVNNSTALTSPTELAISGKYIYALDNKGIWVLDRSDFTLPVVGKLLQDYYCTLGNLEIDGHYVYAADSAYGGISVFDFTDFSHPICLEHDLTWLERYIKDVRVLNGYVYCVNDRGLWISTTAYLPGSVVELNTATVEVRGGARGYLNPKLNEKACIILRPRQSGEVKVGIYTLNGQLVWSQNMDVVENGLTNIFWDCTNKQNAVVASGVYLVSIQGAGYKEKKKLVVVR